MDRLCNPQRIVLARFARTTYIHCICSFTVWIVSVAGIEYSDLFEAASVAPEAASVFVLSRNRGRAAHAGEFPGNHGPPPGIPAHTVDLSQKTLRTPERAIVGNSGFRYAARARSGNSVHGMALDSGSDSCTVQR